MGVLFGGECTGRVLHSICMHYGTGGIDAGGLEHVSVRWKQFSIDFDNVPLYVEPELEPDPELMEALRAMRAEATHKRLDMTDAFEEYSGTLQEKNTGIMTKNRFRSTMGVLFRGRLSNDVLNAIAIQYGVGDLDPREPGSYMKVRWKQFAIDFDNIPPAPPPPLPDPSPEILEQMREMNVYTNLNALDLAHEFEEYMGGKDKCSSDLMPREKFKGALGVVLGRPTSLYQLPGELLENICHCYAAGEREARDPRYFTHVQWREFCLDVNRIQPQPFLEGLQGDVVTYPQVGQYGNAEDTDSKRIHPVYGTLPTCVTHSFASMPSGMPPSALAGGSGGAKAGGKVSVAAPSGGAAAAKPASPSRSLAGSAAGSAVGDKSTRSNATARSGSARQAAA